MSETSRQNPPSPPSSPSPPRLHLPDGFASPGGETRLPEAEARHVRSRRLAAGDPVVLLDGRGRRSLGRLGGSLATVAVEEELPPRGEPGRPVTVLLAAADPERVEWAVEKGTECGAAAFVLFPAARSQGPHVRRVSERIERLARIAAEATKQCDRTLVPGVRWEPSLEALLASLPSGALAEPRTRAFSLYVALPGAPPPPRRSGAGPAAFAVGPEGGWDPSEEEEMFGSGAVPVGLGSRVLRLETAVVVGLTLLAGEPFGPEPGLSFSATIERGGPE